MSVHDNLEAFSLGALDRAEACVFAEHLGHCAPCRAELKAYEPVVDALRSLPLAVPPPIPRPPRRGVPPPGVIGACAAAATLVIGIFAGFHARTAESAQMLSVLQMMSDRPREVRLSGPHASGVVLVGAGRERTAIIVRGLPAPPPGRGYQVWSRGSRIRTPGMLHRVGSVELLVAPGDYVDGASRFGITIEPAAGSRHRTGPIVLGGPAS